MYIKYAKRVFVASCVGIVLSVIIRENFDGVAFLFCLLAAVSYMTYVILEESKFFDGLKKLDIDLTAKDLELPEKCEIENCNARASATVHFAGASIRVCSKCEGPVSEWTGANEPYDQEGLLR